MYLFRILIGGILWLDQNGDNQCVYVVVITISLIILVQKKLIVKSPECFPTEGSRMRRPGVFMQSVILLLWRVGTVKFETVLGTTDPVKPLVWPLEAKQIFF